MPASLPVRARARRFRAVLAAAIAPLEGDVVEIRSDVDALARDMQAAIREADAFLANFPKS